LHVYKAALEQAERVVAVHTSSKLSGIYATACMAAQMVDPERIAVVDGEQASQATAMLVRKAVQLADAGWEQQQIVEELLRARSQVGLLAYLDTLQYIARGGRVPKLAAWMGELLSIKPIVEVTGGEAIPVAKVRGRKRGQQELLAQMEARVGQQPMRVMVGYTDVPEAAEELVAEIKARFRVVEIGTFLVGSTIGTHLGPGAYGVVWAPEQR
jgi:DegV family protein with EDD domain